MSRRPQIGIVVHDFDPGFGQGRYCVELVERLSPHFNFTVYANRFDYQGPANFRAVKVPAVRSRALTTVFSFVLAAEYALRRRPCDLIHAQGLSSWRADVITAHMCNPAKLRASAADGETLARTPFMRAVLPLERAFFRRNRRAHLIAISRSVQREVAEEYHWAGQQSVIYHGTDTVRFAPASAEGKRALQAHFGLQPQHWNWLFMGEAVKGLAESIQALAHFPEARLLVVSRSDARPWRALAAAKGVAGQLLWHGFESQPERAFRAVDLFCYPSFYDPFGMVAAEAMACGLPVIVGSSIGVAELIEDGVEGVHCKAFDVPALTQALSRLKEAPGLAEQMGVAARRRISQHGWERCAAQTAAVYESRLGDGGRKWGRSP